MHSEDVISNTENKTQPIRAAVPNHQSAASASTTGMIEIVLIFLIKIFSVFV